MMGWFLLVCRFGVLATQDRGELEGYPSGSVVEYATDAQVSWRTGGWGPARMLGWWLGEVAIHLVAAYCSLPPQLEV
jgi:hypothetical protein